MLGKQQQQQQQQQQQEQQEEQEQEVLELNCKIQNILQRLNYSTKDTFKSTLVPMIIILMCVDIPLLLDALQSAGHIQLELVGEIPKFVAEFVLCPSPNSIFGGEAPILVTTIYYNI